jgi:hypothetical protein
MRAAEVTAAMEDWHEDERADDHQYLTFFSDPEEDEEPRCRLQRSTSSPYALTMTKQSDHP